MIIGVTSYAGLPSTRLVLYYLLSIFNLLAWVVQATFWLPVEAEAQNGGTSASGRHLWSKMGRIENGDRKRKFCHFLLLRLNREPKSSPWRHFWWCHLGRCHLLLVYFHGLRFTHVHHLHHLHPHVRHHWKCQWLFIWDIFVFVCITHGLLGFIIIIFL